MLVALLALLLLLLAAAPLRAAPGMYVGAADDLPKSAVLTDSKAQFELARAAGLQAMRVTALWSRGQREPDEALAAQLATTAQAAALTGIRVIVMVYPAVASEVPLDDASRADFASFIAELAGRLPTVKDFMIGNEPNKQFFWAPQYNPDGTSASPAAYVALLAAVYDALKAVDPAVTVIGGPLAPRGNDNPQAASNISHSPGAFILRMGEAYRASGRAAPLMDHFGFHAYGDRSEQPPSYRHPRSTTISLSDYGRLVSFLGQAFDGTAQPGSRLPIVYDEYGTQTAPPPEKAGLYTDADSPAAADAVDEARQAAYYRQALEIASCQPNVVGLLFFHTVDETDLRRWQSGLYYPDLTPKTSLAAVRTAVLEARRGVVARCPGLAAPVELLVLEYRGQDSFPAENRSWRLRVGCVRDCLYLATLERLPAGTPVLAARGSLVGGRTHTVRLPARRVAPGTYRLALRLVTRVNPGEPLVRTSEELRVG